MLLFGWQSHQMYLAGEIYLDITSEKKTHKGSILTCECLTLSTNTQVAFGCNMLHNRCLCQCLKSHLLCIHIEPKYFDNTKDLGKAVWLMLVL